MALHHSCINFFRGNEDARKVRLITTQVGDTVQIARLKAISVSRDNNLLRCCDFTSRDPIIYITSSQF